MLEHLLIVVLTGVFTVMASALISVMLAPKVLKKLVEEAISAHVSIDHQIDIKTAIVEHTNACVAYGTIQQIRDAVLWLVMKNGGDPKDIGLVK